MRTANRDSSRELQVGINDLQTKNPKIASSWHPTKNGNLKPSMVNSSSDKKVWWIGDCGHEWESKVKTRNRGKGCPVCHGRIVIVGINDLLTTFPNLASQWHPTKNGNLSPSEMTFGSARKVWWRCECGNEWEATINYRSQEVSKYRPSGCFVCNTKQITKVLKGVNDLTKTHPEIASQWNYDKNEEFYPYMFTANSNKKFWWKCENGHEWKAQIKDRTSGHRCAVCIGRRVLSGFNDLQTTHPELASEWHPIKNGDLMPDAVTFGSGRKVWWKCKKNHEWEAQIVNRKNGKGCPECSLVHTSKIETNLHEALLSKYPQTVKNHSVSAPWGKRRNARCDIALLDYRIIIEYDGSFWHREKADKDMQKTQALLDAKWNVIRVREMPLGFLELTHNHLAQIEYDYHSHNVPGLVNRLVPIIEGFKNSH